MFLLLFALLILPHIYDMARTPPYCNHTSHDPLLVSRQLGKYTSIRKTLARILKSILMYLFLFGTKQVAICRRRRLCSSSWPHFKTIGLLDQKWPHKMSKITKMCYLCGLSLQLYKNILGILDMTDALKKSRLKEEKNRLTSG